LYEVECVVVGCDEGVDVDVYFGVFGFGVYFDVELLV